MGDSRPDSGKTETKNLKFSDKMRRSPCCCSPSHPSIYKKFIFKPLAFLLREFAGSGDEMTIEALSRNSDSGTLSVDQGSVDTAGQPVSPAARTPVAQKRWAWALALLPMAATAFLVPLVSIGLDGAWVTLFVVLASAALVIVDRRDLIRTGRLPSSSLPSTAWFLFPPAYLSRRARLLGAPKTQFWVSLGCLLLAFVARTAIAVAIIASVANVAADPVLPGCADRGSMPDVVNVFDNVESVRDAGLSGVIVTDQTEIAQDPGSTPTKRFCSGKMQASNDREYDIQYAFEIVQGQVIVHIQLP